MRTVIGHREGILLGQLEPSCGPNACTTTLTCGEVVGQLAERRDNSFILNYQPNTDWLSSIQIGSLTETFNPKSNSGGLLGSMSVTTPTGSTPTLYSASYMYYPTDQRQTDTISVANADGMEPVLRTV